MSTPLHNVRATPIQRLLPPAEIKNQFPLSKISEETVALGQHEIEAILKGDDKRFLLIVGPCSIHDPEAAYAYAEKLVALRKKYSEKICIIMRVYFEKPRTVVGWKGLINDPHLDGSYDIDGGRKLAREILCTITNMGLPTATEFLDSNTPQFIDELVSWAAIGARTVESQTHREMASGLSMPVGFKNGTSGSIKIAVDAIQSARAEHRFAGIDDEAGEEWLFQSKGNPWGHLVLRGGAKGPNFDPIHVAEAIELLTQANIDPRIIIDCSHANAERDYAKQSIVLRDVVHQRNAGTTAIIGAMIESHLFPGKQDIEVKPLKYGISVTDACVGWEDTEAMIDETFNSIQ